MSGLFLNTLNSNSTSFLQSRKKLESKSRQTQLMLGTNSNRTRTTMKAHPFLSIAAIAIVVASRSPAAEPTPGENPADHLPPHITQVAWFGERADWSHDGKRILFLTKTFGDAMELDVATKRIRNLTANYPHRGYTRALYLANGDILLSGPEVFDPRHIGEARVQCFLSVLD